MNLAQAVRQYFNGESREEKVARFTLLSDDLADLRSEMASLIKGMTAVINNVDSIKKSADTIINDRSASPEAVAIVLDNIMLSDSRLSEYMKDFTTKINTVKSAIVKSESELVGLLTSNPEMASIICNVTHDNNLEKSLKVIVTEYRAGTVTREELVKAYRAADSSKKTNRSFDSVFD